MADDQKTQASDDTNDQEPSNEGSNSIGSENPKPTKYDPIPKNTKDPAPGAQSEDDADNPRYDDPNSGKKDLDSQILAKRKIGKWMAITAAVFLLIFTFTFFVYAIYFAHGFISVYTGHVHKLVPDSGSTESAAVLPFLVPLMPATLFSALGIATMVTAMRFVNAYVNAVDERSDGGFIIERIIREIAGAVKSIKSSGND